MPRSTRLMGNLTLGLASTVVSLILLEVLYRFFLFGWSSLSVKKMNSLAGVGASGLLQASADQEIRYELKPDLATYFKLVPFETNSRGLRDREYSLAKPAEVFRIAVVGDSFTVPSGVRLEDAFHTLLEDWLNASRPTEVINFAVSGYSLRQYRAVIEKKCLPFDPDLILIGFCARNDHKPPKWDFDQPFVPQPIQREFFRSFALMGWRKAKSFRAKREVAKRTVRPVLKRKHKRYLQYYLAMLGDLSREREVPIVVVLLDNQKTENDFLASEVGQNGLFFLNATPPFEGRDLADFMMHPLDSHPNAAANEIFAREIYPYLKDSFPR